MKEKPDVGTLLMVFQKILRAYATKLFMKLPKGGTGIVTTATGMDGQINTSDKDERMICYIVNTTEYCHKTEKKSITPPPSLRNTRVSSSPSVGSETKNY